MSQTPNQTCHRLHSHRLFLVAVGFALIAGEHALAQVAAPPRVPGTKPQEKKRLAIPDRVLKPFLWKIDTDVPNYIFGTVHVAEQRVLKLHPAANLAFEKADAAYFEIDFSKAAQQGESMTLPGNQQLSDTLPNDLIQRLRNRVHRYSPGLMDRSNFRPVVWPLLITQLEGQTRFRSDPLDMQLFRQAKRSNKTVGGLEDPALQLRGLFKLSREEQRQFVRSSLDSLDAAERIGEDQLLTTIGYYLRGDEKQFYQYFLDDMKKGGLSEEMQKKIMQGLLITRNRHMARAIARLLKEQPDRSHFFAIGTAHMLGNDSVLTYLEKAEIKTTRVTE